MSDAVTVTRQGAVTTLTINRPDAMNALDRGVHTALQAGLREAEDAAVRCVVITGAGRAFCAGQDLNEVEDAERPLGELLEETYHPTVRSIRALRKPVLAALNGAAAGAGLSLALACDVRVASDKAVLVPGFAGIGLVPDAGGTWFLERLLGYGRAFEWMCSNRRLSAEEALAWGLVSEVVPADGFEARVREVAEAWAAMPTGAVAGTKALLAGAHAHSLEEQLAAEAEEQTVAAASADFAEGVAAFLEKRPPRFSGR
ncbi:MAG: enoyl-CoA hydratase-related protein [Gaiella sp.]